jgi:RNA polymerase sigma-70 factor (ECF subfamily)
VRLIEHPPADDGRLRAWLFTVAANLARDSLKSAWRRRGLLSRRAGRAPTGDPPTDPLTAVERAERVRRVRAALDGLSPKERTILLLREEGFTHREIAAAVDTTTKSVGTLIARALEKLARRIDLDAEAL